MLLLLRAVNTHAWIRQLTPRHTQQRHLVHLEDLLPVARVEALPADIRATFAVGVINNHRGLDVISERGTMPVYVRIVVSLSGAALTG
jgi:hypothetical protein